MLSAAFGALATVLACVGLYGVLAYNVTRRSREIGLRMALGAQSADVVRLVLREALLLLGLGALLGLPAALGLARTVQSQLFCRPAHSDRGRPGPGGAGALAGYLPARRASRVDPMSALRCE